MDVVADILQESACKSGKYKPIEVGKLLDVEYDVGALLVYDPNELDKRLLK